MCGHQIHERMSVLDVLYRAVRCASLAIGRPGHVKMVTRHLADGTSCHRIMVIHEGTWKDFLWAKSTFGFPGYPASVWPGNLGEAPVTPREDIDDPFKFEEKLKEVFDECRNMLGPGGKGGYRPPPNDFPLCPRCGKRHRILHGFSGTCPAPEQAPGLERWNIVP